VSGRRAVLYDVPHYGVYVRSQAYGRFAWASAVRRRFCSTSRPSLTTSSTAELLRHPLAVHALAGAPSCRPSGPSALPGGPTTFTATCAPAPTRRSTPSTSPPSSRTLRIPASPLMVDAPTAPDAGWGNMDWDTSFPDPAKMVSDLHTRGLELVLWIANRSGTTLHGRQRAGFLFPGSQSLGPAADLASPPPTTGTRTSSRSSRARRQGLQDRSRRGREMPASCRTRTSRSTRAWRRRGWRPCTERRVRLRPQRRRHGPRYAAVWNGEQRELHGTDVSVACALRSGMIVMPMWGSDTGGYGRSNTTPPTRSSPAGSASPRTAPSWRCSSADGTRPGTTTPHRRHRARPLGHALRSDPVCAARFCTRHAHRRASHARARARYPDDPEVATRADEYLFGSELLVAPVLTAASPRAPSTSRRPLARLQRPSHVFAGGKTVTATRPLE
jgi:hypothetical protein